MITPKIGKSAVSDPRKCVEPVWDPGAWWAVWAHSAKRAARDNKAITAQENRARAVIDGEKTPGPHGL